MCSWLRDEGGDQGAKVESKEQKIGVKKAQVGRKLLVVQSDPCYGS